MSETVLDYTSLSTAASCGRKFQYAVEERLAPKGARVPLIAGSIMHEALRSLYADGWDIEAAVSVLHAAFDRSGWTPPRVCMCEKKSNCKCYAYMTRGHLEVVLRNYHADRSKSPTWIEAESTLPAAESSRLEEAIVWDWKGESGEVLRLGGKIDLPTVIAGKRCIVDHKTSTSWLNSFWFTQRFGLGLQFRLYAAAMQALHGERYEEAWVNAIYIGQSAADDATAWARRQSVPHMLKKVADITPASLEEAWQWAKGHSETIDLWRKTGRFPQNERACGDWGSCEFAPLCSVAPGMRREIEKRRGYEVRVIDGLLASGADSSEEVA